MGVRTRVAVCIVLLAVVGAVASVGTASAAVDHTTQVDHRLDVDEDDERIDQHLDSGGLYWQGQSLGFNDTDGMIDADQLLIREYDTEDDEVGSLVREVDFDPNGTVVETDGLDGTYVLVPTDQRGSAVVIEDGTVTGMVGIEHAQPFEILTQTLTVRWEGGEAGTSSTEREIELASNRVRYNVNVSSPTLSFGELEQIFMADRDLREHNAPYGDRRPFEQRYRMYDAYAEEDVIVLRGFSDDALETDFSRIETLPEVFTVEVTDTGVRRSAELPTTAVETGPFAISELAVQETADPGESVSLEATVTNEWPTPASREIVFELGETRTAVGTSLDGGGETTVSATLTAPTEPGDASYAVTTDGDSVEGTIRVIDPNPPEETDSDGGGGIIGTALGLVYPQGVVGLIMTVLSLATFVVWRRR